MSAKKDSGTALAPLADLVCDGDMEKLVHEISQFFQSVADHLPLLTKDSPFLTSMETVPDHYIITKDAVEEQLEH